MSTEHQLKQAKAFYLDRYFLYRGSGYDHNAAKVAAERYMKEVGLWPKEWR